MGLASAVHRVAHSTCHLRVHSLVVLFGVQAAVGVVWYTSNFYALYFLTTTLEVPTADAYAFVATTLVFSLPLYVLFGWLSDKVGRK